MSYFIHHSLFFFRSQVDVASLITRKLLKVSMKHIEIISKARQKGTAVHIKPFLLVLTNQKQNLSDLWPFLCSEEHRVSSASCPGGIWSRPSCCPSQSPRWAPLPQEADWDALPLHSAPQGHRLQVTLIPFIKGAAVPPCICQSVSQNMKASTSLLEDVWLISCWSFIFFFFPLPYLLTPHRSLTLLIREVLAGSVFLPSLDYLADPVSEDPLLWFQVLC